MTEMDLYIGAIATLMFVAGRSVPLGVYLVNFDQSASPLSLHTDKRQIVLVDENAKLEPNVTRPTILVSNQRR